MEVEIELEQTEEEIVQQDEEMYEELTEEVVHKDKDGNEIYPTHVIVLKSGEVFMCHETIELERMIGVEETEFITVGNVLDYPEIGDRSMITVVNKNIDFIQESFNQEAWDELVTTAIESTIKGQPEDTGDKDMYA